MSERVPAHVAKAKRSLAAALRSQPWFVGVGIVRDADEHLLVVLVSEAAQEVEKTVPPVHEGVRVRTEVSGRARKLPQ